MSDAGHRTNSGHNDVWFKQHNVMIPGMASGAHHTLSLKLGQNWEKEKLPLPM